MPDLDRIVPVLYETEMPYHKDYDNLPLRGILERIDQVNLAADWASTILEQSIGDQGTLSARLAQSLDALGDLRSLAVDDALHNIAYHTDGEDEDGVGYVRMLADERAKLTNVADSATALRLLFRVGDTTTLFDNQLVEIRNSNSITWEVGSPDPDHPETGVTIKAAAAFPVDAAHQHHYGVAPVDVDPFGANAGSKFRLPVPYDNGTLRVYVNGFRLVDGVGVWVKQSEQNPQHDLFPCHHHCWKLFTLYTRNRENANPDEGTFVVQPGIAHGDVIRADFDVAFTA